MRFEMPKIEINKFDLVTCNEPSGAQTTAGQQLYEQAVSMEKPTTAQGRATLVVTF